jgi:hypothetical protein
MSEYFSSDDDIERLGLGLLDRTLPKREWTHAAHFAATLWMLRRRPDIRPEQDLPAIILAYNEATGGENTDTAGYHETITQASIGAARRFLAAHPADAPLHELADLLMASPLGDPDWLLAYWSRERLFSVEARRAWLGPDLRPLPA